MTLTNRMKTAKRLYAIDPKSRDPRVLEMKDRVATARKEAEAKKRLATEAAEAKKKGAK